MNFSIVQMRSKAMFFLYVESGFWRMIFDGENLAQAGILVRMRTREIDGCIKRATGERSEKSHA